ncbi:MAG TPA: hypothetical protein VF301_01605 [Ginsengibacter sp.]
MKLLTAQRFVRLFSITLLLLLGISALAGGWGMIGDPSGEALGWTTEMLIYSPFNDYMIPGIMLFLVPGVVSVVIPILVIKKVKTYPFLIIGQGSILLLWIIIQVILIWQFNLLHLICFTTGFLIVVSGIFLMKNKC